MKKKNLLIFILLISLFGCESKIDGFFYISNGSRDQSEILLRLIIDNDTIFEKNVKYSNIAPDLQYIENRNLTKGKHKIIFEVVHTNLKQIENLVFDKDTWVFLSYEYKKPADSLKRAELNKSFGGVKDSTNLILYDGQKPSLTFHVMENEPKHQ
ncbi:hypothetical protein ACFO3O_00545 [Dokdonia ponticola]|uniref:Lipoprotein n=1 Tax=Dokdonia ponticola TaxID=2041041 RepID=A0ABV9HQE9_9FLAO